MTNVASFCINILLCGVNLGWAEAHEMCVYSLTHNIPKHHIDMVLLCVLSIADDTIADGARDNQSVLLVSITTRRTNQEKEQASE